MPLLGRFAKVQLYDSKARERPADRLAQGSSGRMAFHRFKY